MQAYLQSQFQTRIHNITQLQNSDVTNKEKEAEKAKLEAEKNGGVFIDQESEASHLSDIEIESEIIKKGYNNTVNEICSRQRYNI